MTTIYDKIDVALKEIRKMQNLIKQGLAKPNEKVEAFRIAKEAAGLFADDIFKRRAEKLNRITVWSKEPRNGFVSADEANQLDSWITLLEEYKDGKKIKSELSSEKVHIQSIVDDNDQHIFITEKGSKDHAHLIVDHRGTRELIRVDQNDQAPSELIKSVEARLELKTGEVVQITKNTLSFVGPESSQADIRAYTANKDGYFVLEIYNNGDEDLENFLIQANWIQPEGPREKVLKEFNSETDYLVMARPKSLNMLKKEERVYSHIPSMSVDKKIKITISCKGMRSSKTFQKVFELETKNKY